MAQNLNSDINEIVNDDTTIFKRKRDCDIENVSKSMKLENVSTSKK